MRRRKLLVALAGLAAVIAVGLIALWPSSSRVTPADFHRIKYEMSKLEVMSILGPPGDYRTGPTQADGYKTWILTDRSTGGDEWWKGDSATARVSFASGDTVDSAYCESTQLQSQNPLSNLLWRVKRQLHRWSPNRFAPVN
jgi:hypothetical protein